MKLNKVNDKTAYENLLVKYAELKTENNKLLDVINNQDVKIADLEKENAELKHSKKTVVHLADCLEEKMKEKSVLEMVGGEKHINPHYDIKAESSSCYLVSKGFTGVEINGVRFSNIREMKLYMIKQRDQLTKAKEHIENLLYYVQQCTCERSNYAEMDEDIKQAGQFLKEIEK